MSDPKVSDTTSFLGCRRDRSRAPGLQGRGLRRRFGWPAALLLAGASMAPAVACNDRRIVFCNEDLIGRAGGCPAAGGDAGTGGSSAAGASAGGAPGGAGGVAGSPVGGSGGEATGAGGSGASGGGGGDSATDASAPEDGGIDSGVFDAAVAP
jgi:hypothetical protein